MITLGFMRKENGIKIRDGAKYATHEQLVYLYLGLSNSTLVVGFTFVVIYSY